MAQTDAALDEEGQTTTDAPNPLDITGNELAREIHEDNPELGPQEVLARVREQVDEWDFSRECQRFIDTEAACYLFYNVDNVGDDE